MSRRKKNYGNKVVINFLIALLGKWIIVWPLAFLGGLTGFLGTFVLISYVLWTYFGLVFVYCLYKFLNSVFFKTKILLYNNL